MKIKTSELTGAALDWAVAEAHYQESPPLKSWVLVLHKHGEETHPYSTAWDWGGPLIEREGIRLHRSVTGQWWAGSEAEPQRPIEGPTPLVAAMRCFVASQLGDEVEIPEELL